MASVETVRGPVEPGDLGPTLMHEHVFVLSTEHVQNYGSTWWDEEARVADAIVKLNALHAKGIHTIVGPVAAPNWHYEHISDDVLPALLEAGVTQAQLDTMLIENPLRYFTPTGNGAA
jgi:predicted metal-dependent phosphotriesterase family hydrolase